MPQVARSERLSNDTKMHPLRDNKLLIVCKIDRVMARGFEKTVFLCSKDSQGFTIYELFVVRLWKLVHSLPLLSKVSLQ